MVLEGHCRSGKFTGGKGLYFLEGSLSLRVKGRVAQYVRV